tara:strand:- start:4029 stop:5051 length:1023 start_codon:yes stop_codon:yes gene_type:complete
MNDKLTTIKLHGALGEKVGRDVWKFSVSTVGEAIRAIESQSKKLFASLIEYEKQNIKYRVMINGKDFVYDKSKDINTEEGIRASELVLPKSNIETIDIIPVLEGAMDDIFAIVIGVVLIAVGVFTFGAGTFLGASLIMAGVGLVAAGIANLLQPMPEFDDFREIEGGGRRSYIFSGPENTIREGGPIFIGYGRLMVGSQVVQSSIETSDVKNGNFTNSNDKMKGGYWGLDRYGLDYRAKSLTETKDGNATGKVGAEQILKDRINQWDQSTGEPGFVDPTLKHNVSNDTTRLVLTNDGESFTATDTMSQEEYDKEQQDYRDEIREEEKEKLPEGTIINPTP